MGTPAPPPPARCRCPWPAALGVLLGAATLAACSAASSSGLGVPDLPPPADGGADAGQRARPDAGSDGGADAGASIVFPRAASTGGRVIASPKLMVVTFAGDALEPSLGQFSDTLVTSTYFATVAKEYGASAITSVGHARLVESAPLASDDAALATWLSKALDGTGPARRAGPEYPLRTLLSLADGPHPWAEYQLQGLRGLPR